MEYRISSKAPGKLNNKGFSLVELIISIAVLVIIMVPLMGNFIRSMQMNNKAEKLLYQGNLGSSILEGLKANSITEIITAFDGQAEDFDIIPNDKTAVIRLLKDGDEYDLFKSTEEQSTYYFGINGIIDGSTVYDALIKMEAAPYQVTTGSGEGTMNNFPMPNVVNLDEKANSLLFSNGISETDSLDTDTLNTFLIWGTAYAQAQLEQSSEYRDYLQQLSDCESRELEGETVPPEDWPVEPTLASLPVGHSLLTFCTASEVVKLITKTMTVTINNDIINYQIEYSCAWPSGSNLDNLIANEVSDVRYAKAIENIYLFYTPSIYNAAHSSIDSPADRIIINNASGNPVNFFAALQNNTTMNNLVDISITGSNLSVYTDISEVAAIPGLNEGELLKTKPEDRIYDVTIYIYKYVNTTVIRDKYKTILYTLTSTKER